MNNIKRKLVLLLKTVDILLLCASLGLLLFTAITATNGLSVNNVFTINSFAATISIYQMLLIVTVIVFFNSLKDDISITYFTIFLISLILINPFLSTETTYKIDDISVKLVETTDNYKFYEITNKEDIFYTDNRENVVSHSFTIDELNNKDKNYFEL